MDIRKIKSLIELIDASTVAEIEIKEGEESLRISRINPHQSAPSATYQANYQAPAAPMPMMATFAAPAGAGEILLDVESEAHGNIIRSPMVGTFYRSSSPESKPFVEVGQNISQGSTICIIEAMKMFNQIESDFSGRVVKVLVENGQPVEYDQPLMIVE